MQIGDRMLYRGDEVKVEWIGRALATVVDSDGRPVTVVVTRLKPMRKVKTENAPT